MLFIKYRSDPSLLRCTQACALSFRVTFAPDRGILEATLRARRLILTILNSPNPALASAFDDEHALFDELRK